ncbi:MAG TPA: 5'/3'-nucleotidase SurE, partial [Kiritimatiellia bacterium]|nr:5'/3'-nucleotidase SurE [Kiritimatiellia bacterium]
MRILLCNDDGIQAPGLHALQNAVKDLGEIHV